MVHGSKAELESSSTVDKNHNQEDSGNTGTIIEKFGPVTAIQNEWIRITY